FTTTGDARLEASPRGLLLLLFAVISGIGYSIVAKRLSHRYRPLTIVRIQNMIGGFYFLPFMVFFEWKATMEASPPLSVLLNLVMLAVFGSSLAFILVTISIREIGISKTNIFTNIIPIITAVSAYFLLGEGFSDRKLIGMSIIISGLFLSQYQKRIRSKVIHER
ncbi:DMT family transporter, partial [Candidatus Mcinerneyibacteriota bacterium]|nr:DMT family transporter [Candidatus Mcinerneyibacteriota bacterium]